MLLQECCRVLTLALHAGPTTTTMELAHRFVPDAVTPDYSLPISKLTKDLLHFAIPAGVTATARRMPGGSVISRTTGGGSVGAYDDGGLMGPVRTDAVTTAASQVISELILCKAPAVLSYLLSCGGLWYLMMLTLQADPQDPTPYVLACVCVKIC